MQSSLKGMVLAGKYRLIRELSRGGMGHIYLAEHMDLEEPRAIKVIREELVKDETTRRRFLREIRATHRVSKQNENVVAIYDDYGFQDGIGYYVMEFLDGRPLSHYIQDSRGTLPIEWSLQVVVAISTAMEEIHQADVIHRDLKPDNIMLLPRPGKPDLVKVFDFGIAKLTDSETRSTSLTQLVGTISYMSPEQIAVPMENIGDIGASEIDHRADIYSLGCILFEMLTGRTPFAPDPSKPVVAPHQLLWAHLHDEPPRTIDLRSEISHSLDEVVQLALRKRPDERFQSMQEFANAILQILGQAEPSSKPLSPKKPPASVAFHLEDTVKPTPLPSAPDKQGVPTQTLDVEDIPTQPPKVGYDPYVSTMLLNPWHMRTQIQSSPWESHTIPDTALSDIVGESGGRVEIEVPEEPTPVVVPEVPPLPGESRPLTGIDTVMDLEPTPEIEPELDPLTIDDSVEDLLFETTKDGLRAQTDVTDEVPREELVPTPKVVDLSSKNLAIVFVLFLVLGGGVGYLFVKKFFSQKQNLELAPPVLRNSLPRLERSGIKRIRPVPRRSPEKRSALRGDGSARCPANMSYFAKGKFLYGSATNDELRSFSEASLQGRGTEAYCIDRYEYPGKGQTPRGMVSWQEAAILCRRKGKRLCSELEWERACKGESVYRYPYGNKFNVNRCNTRGPNHKNRLVKRTGSFPGCKNSFGVYDMSGNVAEWTLSSFYKGSTRRTIRGGSSNRPDWAVRCASRSSANPDVKKPTLGFRCCSKPLR